MNNHPGGYTYWTGRYGVAHSYDERQWWEAGSKMAKREHETGPGGG